MEWLTKADRNLGHAMYCFDHIQVDVVGPLPPFNEFTHLLTIIDCFSRWPEANPLSDTTAASCAQALVFHWIACFGTPLHMSSDRGL